MVTRCRSEPVQAYRDDPPDRPVHLLFIHHSVGGQLLAEPGPCQSTPLAQASIHRTHPNGGGLRALLEKQNYIVHEAAYGSVIGHKTDLFDWLPKFQQQMSRILTTDFQDAQLEDATNEVILFKSCYPNNAFGPDDPAAANPHGPELTLSNARAALTALLREFAKHPEVLFVYLTAPPLRACIRPESALKRLAKSALGRPTAQEKHLRSAIDARAFNRWVVSEQGWLRDYPLRNVAAFDYFDILTGGGKSNFLEFPTDRDYDHHPSSEGQSRAAQQLVPFLNRALRRAGIVA